MIKLLQNHFYFVETTRLPFLVIILFGIFLKKSFLSKYNLLHFFGNGRTSFKRQNQEKYH